MSHATLRVPPLPTLPPVACVSHAPSEHPAPSDRITTLLRLRGDLISWSHMNEFRRAPRLWLARLLEDARRHYEEALLPCLHKAGLREPRWLAFGYEIPVQFLVAPREFLTPILS